MDVYDFIIYKWGKNLEYKSDGLFLKNIVFESINWKVGEIGVGRGVW